MAIMMRQLYEALRDAGASDENAAKAAEEVAGFENRLSGVETKLAVLQWMVATVIVLVLGLYGMIARFLFIGPISH
jgi:hypothetical protein